MLAHNARIQNGISPPIYTIQMLPLDILIGIMAFVKPSDIICLRQTCKIIFQATHFRCVWIDALDRVCQDYGIFRPTFPKDISISQLERVTTSPGRFLSRARQMRPTPKLIIPGCYIRSVNRLGMYSDLDVMLIPGGRYLLQSCSSLVRLLDLGLGVVSDNAVAVVASMHLESGGVWTDAVQSTSDGRGIRFAVLEFASRYKISIFDIYPDSPNPDFMPFSETHLNIDEEGSGFQCCMFADLLLLLHSKKKIMVWDFVEDLWAKWDSEQEILDIYIWKRDIIGLNETDIIVWKLPELQCIIGHQVPFTTWTPFISVAHSYSDADWACINRTCGWYPRNSPMLNRFSIVYTRYNLRGAILSHYTLEHNNCASSSIPDCLPVLLAETSVPGRRSCLAYKLFWTSTEDFALLWMEDEDEPGPCMLTGSTKTGLHGTDVYICGIPMAAYDVSPVLGRLCVDIGDSIKIIDFLP